ncbi:MAG: hypothetical protein SVZ03_05860 [Spirochaetota bacterium]|nr:hypothetical protein [Spirochaetota bacterium]
MRIKEFCITRYGPLGETGKILLGDFNLLYGKNERGKTLTIDALIRLLLGKNVKQFKQLNRVSSDPMGYIILGFTNEEGFRTLPQDGDLTILTKSAQIPLTASDFRNIFIIRNSDLSIADEADYYTAITEKLVGLRTSDISRIRKSLKEIGRLTDGLDYKNDEKTHKLRTRLNRARDLLIKIQSHKKRLREEGYDKLEIRLYRLKEEFIQLNYEVDEYENARNRERFEICSNLLKNFEKRVGELKGMDVYQEDVAQRWQDGEKEVMRSEREILELNNKKDALNYEIDTNEINLREISNELLSMEKRKSLLDEEKPRINDIKDGFTQIHSNISLQIHLKRTLILSISIFFILFLAIIFVKPSAYFYIPGIIALLITITLLGYELIIEIRGRRIKRSFEDVKLNIVQLGINSSTIEEMISGIQGFNAVLDNKKYEFEECKTLLMIKKRHISEVDERLKELKRIIDVEVEKLDTIKREIRIGTIDEYRKILTLKRIAESDKENLFSKLESLLGKAGRNLRENISFWGSKIQELETFRDRGQGRVYDENKYSKLKNKLRGVEKEISGLTERIDRLGDLMLEIERTANDVLVAGGEIYYCKTLSDLDGIENRLRDFINLNDRRRRSIINAVEILDEIERDEKEKVLELFSKDSYISVSNIFETITNGLYDEVIYDKEDERVKVRYSTNELINADVLSGGAYDQLYLSIRLALGEKILKAEKGLFILDDPFIKSDFDRILRQMETLKKISSEGWQILYFSSKNEIIEILGDDINEKRINLININWLN